MTIEKKINGEAVTLTVSGRLDTQTAPELENELDAVAGGQRDPLDGKGEGNPVVTLRHPDRGFFSFPHQSSPPMSLL